MLVIQPGDIAIFRNKFNRLQKGTPVRTFRNCVQITLDDGTHAKVVSDRVRLLRASSVPAVADPATLCSPRTIAVIPSVFERPGAYGDFGAMCVMPEFACDSLFIYNDNMTCFLAKDRLFPGGGNACIRPHRNKHSMPIPTGEYDGFDSIHDWFGEKQVKDHIADAMYDIEKFLAENPHVTRVFYSCKSHGDAIMGKGIFDVGDEVLLHITHAIHSLSQKIM